VDGVSGYCCGVGIDGFHHRPAGVFELRTTFFTAKTPRTPRKTKGINSLRVLFLISLALLASWRLNAFAVAVQS
jgi:hypothetical protein